MKRSTLSSLFGGMAHMTISAQCLLALACLVCLSSMAGAQVLTFEGLQNLEPIDNYYNGGFGGDGSGPGPNYGITFGSDSLAVIDAADGGTGNFSNAPSGDSIAFFLNGTGDVMDVAAGFDTGFSFYYSAAQPGSVAVYSGLDGTGTLLSSLSLGQTADPYNVWVPVGVLFSGTAQSVVFSGSANFIGFDNITLGSATAGSGVVPEPASLGAWSLLALCGTAYGVRRRRKCA
ncbi:MAG TPA: hypothetical protein VGG64_28615 [Pirellulales bacterium]|jgi:hypothetical protein